jgi:hypothetical protein
LKGKWLVEPDNTIKTNKRVDPARKKRLKIPVINLMVSMLENSQKKVWIVLTQYNAF